MDFFKSVFSTDPDPDPDREQTDIDQQDEEQEAETETETSTATESPLAAWKNIGGFIKTIQFKSESVIQTYRKDLEEFSTGLKKETSVFKEVAAKVVNDLPGSLEAGASAATESLESVGQAIDEFGGSVWRGTNHIILQGKDAILSMDSDSSMSNLQEDASNLNSSSFGKKYSRFEMQVLGIQNDENTYIEEVESENDYEKWRGGFNLEEKEEEIEGLIYENEKLEGLFEKLVPDVIDRETFWCRYFYKVYKLKLAEDTRANLVKRVIQGEEEEELTWSDDEDDDENENSKQDVEEKIKEDDRGKITENSQPMKEEKGIEEAKHEDVTERVRNLVVVEVEKPINEFQVEDVGVEQPSGGDESTVVKEEVPVESKSLETSKPEEMTKDMKSEETANDTNSEDKLSVGTKSNEMVHVGTESEEKVLVDSISEEKVPVDPKLEDVASEKARESDVVSTQPSMQMEVDNEWDELEDFGENEDKNVEKPNVSMKPVDLRKRLSAAEDDEDLTWDIEDDDD